MTRRPSVGLALAFVALLGLVGVGSLLTIAYGLHVLATPQREPERLGTTLVRDAESGQEEGGVPAGPLFAGPVEYTFSVYHLSRKRSRPKRVVRSVLGAGYGDLHIVEPETENPPLPAVVVQELSTDELPPPSLELVPYVSRGLTEVQVERLQRAARVTALRFASEAGAEDLASLRDAYSLTLVIATATDGLIYDAAVGELFTTEAWEATRLLTWKNGTPHLPDHVFIHAYSTGTFNRAVTLGMVKFGLPDLVFDRFTRSASGGVSNILKLAAQTMLEKGQLERVGRLTVSIDALENRRLRETLAEQCFDGAKKRAELQLTLATPQEGDPKGRLWEIILPGEAHELQQRQDDLLEKLFGSSEEVTQVEHDAEILAASRRARQRLLGDLKQKFGQGLAPGELLLVKAPFVTPEGGNEWLWLEVIQWKGTEVRGILMNDPHDIPGLEKGARVTKTEEELFDYILVLADGSRQGDETGEIMRRQQQARQ